MASTIIRFLMIVTLLSIFTALPMASHSFGGFESNEGTDGIGEWNFNFTSDRAPMEGDFYAKGGNDSFAYNSGFGDRDGAKILVPDTVAQRISITEPGTMLLFGGGILGIAVWRRRRTRMQN